jgi:hypothetical protein
VALDRYSIDIQMLCSKIRDLEASNERVFGEKMEVMIEGKSGYTRRCEWCIMCCWRKDGGVRRGCMSVS